MEIPIRIWMSDALADAGLLLSALARAGGEDGLGRDHIRVSVQADVASSRVYSLGANDLQAIPFSSSVIPRFGIGLTTPFLVRDPQRAAQPLAFADLFRAAIGTIRTLFAMNGETLAADFTVLQALADRVRLVEHCYESFEQRTYSSKQGPGHGRVGQGGGTVQTLIEPPRGLQPVAHRERILRGVVGGGVYADVPMPLLPWMLWGGRLHSGQSRVTGAGGWRLVLD